MEPTIQHWLAAVARAAGFDEAGGPSVDSDTEIGNAWERVAAGAAVDSDALAGVVANHFRLNRADLDAADPHAHRLLPGSLARSLCVLPLSYTERNLVVATADPVSLEAERELGRVTDRTVVYRIAPPERIREAIDATYEPPVEEDDPAARARTDDEGIHVLVVDDDADTRTLLRTVLEGHGYRVTEADDGPAALDALERDDEIGLMTLDLWMEEMDGVDVLETARRREATRELPVIVATGSDDPEVEIRLFEAGADDFIVKPLDPRRFILRVEAVLRRRASLAPA